MWNPGIWLGRSTETNEHLVGTSIGVVQARTVKRRPETLKWDRKLYAQMNFAPWSVGAPVASPETGWKLTSGGKVCEEERSAVKRRDRLSNHTLECNERQADFGARLCEMSMVSSSDASSSTPVLVPSIGIGLLLSRPSAQAEFASSSSVSGDMEIAALKEGPHSLIPELECTDEKEWGAMSAGRTSEPLFCSTLGQQIYKTKPERLTLRKVPGIDIPGGVGKRPKHCTS